MKVYLSGAFSRQSDFRILETDLKNAGHKVTSRWLTDLKDSETPKEGRVEDNAVWPHRAILDIKAADVVVMFSDTGEHESKGGRHAEWG